MLQYSHRLFPVMVNVQNHTFNHLTYESTIGLVYFLYFFFSLRQFWGIIDYQFQQFSLLTFIVLKEIQIIHKICHPD